MNFRGAKIKILDNTEKHNLFNYLEFINIMILSYFVKCRKAALFKLKNEKLAYACGGVLVSANHVVTGKQEILHLLL